jgi:hypothetical protein
MDTAAILPAPTAQPTTEDKVDTTVAVAGALAAQLVPGQAGAVISSAVALEPEVYHLISALIHLWKKK